MAVPSERVAEPAAARERASLQTARGIACVLLVVYHVIGNAPVNGLGVPIDSPWRIMTLLFEHLRMPLFSFLSGFVYAYRPALPGQERTFGAKKLRRLALPFVVVSTLFFLVQALTPGTNLEVDFSRMWRIYFFEYAHFWFLQAIILIFAFTLLAERWLHSLRGLLLTLAVLFATQLTVQGTKFFSIDGALYLAPFFVLGIGANRFRAAFSGERVRMVCLAILVAAWSYYAMLCFTDPLAAPGKRTALGSLLSVVSCLAVIHWTPRVRWLAWVGAFSFTVYLYHVFFTAAARIGLNALGDPGNAVHVMVGLAAGLLGPILVELTVQRWPPLARRALLGQS